MSNIFVYTFPFARASFPSVRLMKNSIADISQNIAWPCSPIERGACERNVDDERTGASPRRLARRCF